MKRADIKATVEKHLADIGIGQGQYLWQPLTAELLVIVGDGFKRMKLKSGMSQRDLLFQLGRMSGWLEAAGIARIQDAPEIAITAKARKPVAAKANGRHHPQAPDARA